ncbi:hypothetical protein LT679_04405 [Mucilaginibacter roseus]|uniref:Uncharacterized protein n=1 Tax=Mucilaginibacter roseus TaxID=1528868 RepID=A0ABS8TY96_9SPHI|nr:hypothetical protein [Mucilaginibacter roseus]MCD8739834.1 hypothetical protein [Mucilaginibacter roseus]
MTNDNALCQQMKVNLCNAGEFITVKNAADSLTRYFKLPTTPPHDDPKHVYGHTFGLNKIRRMLFDIDLYNAGLTVSEPRIAGIRVYYGFSERHDPDFPLNEACADLLFMPVLDNGVDIYNIHLLTGTEQILSASRPCPNQCGTPPLQFIQE